MDKKRSYREVKSFVEKVKRAVRPDVVILFGSRASGETWQQSDYDFIIVSPVFEGMHWLERISLLIKLWNLPKDIDILPYTPAEFEAKKKTSSFIRSALKKSVRLI